jgi:hypothetical protein
VCIGYAVRCAGSGAPSIRVTVDGSRACEASALLDARISCAMLCMMSSGDRAADGVPAHIPATEGASPAQFAERVIPCASREDAAREADEQQALDTDDAVWIYTCAGGQWVAKRTPRDMSAASPKRLQWLRADRRPFESRVIVCADRLEAKERAREEEARDTPDAYWAYAKRGGQWVAWRRRRKSRLEAIAEALFTTGPYIDIDS